MTIEPAVLKVADAVGALMEAWGFRRNMGRMWAVLYLEDHALTAADLGERLGLSTGAVSMLLNELIQWEIIKKTWVVGERREHFEAETSIWKMVSRVFRERELRWIRTAHAAFAEAGAELPAGANELIAQRIAGLSQLAEVGAGLLETMLEGAAIDSLPIKTVGELAKLVPKESRHVIRARELTKHFQVHKRAPGLAAALRSLVRRKYEVVKAVDGVSFTIERGERVGFLGPNGAGKTTTLKVLSGLLHPTTGEVSVEDFTPSRRQAGFLGKITLVMGQKSQLIWDLPPSETYAMNRAVFDVPQAQYDQTLKELTELLELGPLLTKPTRQLSLGERMKCELAAALLHQPTTLFLDEPTIGLDVAMQVAIRDFVRSYNQRHEATVLLTSHYMDDVVALCPRIIVIDQGKLIHDGDLRQLIKTMDPDKRVSFTLTQAVADADLARMGTLLARDGLRITLKVAEREVPAVIGQLLGPWKAGDLAIEDPPLEDVLRVMFGKHREAS